MCHQKKSTKENYYLGAVALIHLDLGQFNPYLYRDHQSTCNPQLKGCLSTNLQYPFPCEHHVILHLCNFARCTGERGKNRNCLYIYIQALGITLTLIIVFSQLLKSTLLKYQTCHSWLWGRLCRQLGHPDKMIVTE